MRIRTTTDPGASPPPGLNKNSNDQARSRRSGTGVLGLSVTDRRAGMHPLPLVASIMAITSPPRRGDQW
jgi:hypothetical protein